MSTFTPEVWDDTLLKQSCRLSASKGSRRSSSNGISNLHDPTVNRNSTSNSSLDRAANGRESASSRSSSPGPERKQSSSKKQKQQQSNGVIAYSMSTMFSDPKSIDEMDLDEKQIEALLNQQAQKWTIFSLEEDFVKPQHPVGPFKVHSGRFFAHDSDESDSDTGDHVVPGDHDNVREDGPRRSSSTKKPSPLVPSHNKKKEEMVYSDQIDTQGILVAEEPREVRRVGSSHSLFRDFFHRHKESKLEHGNNMANGITTTHPENKTGTTGIFGRKSITRPTEPFSERMSSSSGVLPTPIATNLVPPVTSGVASPLGSSGCGITMERKLSSKGSLQDEYGEKRQALGRGANAVVKLCVPANGEPGERYAIKEFRKRRRDETPKEYLKKVVSEFCISSTLKHENVIKTVDLIQDESKNWCEVMEYMEGGDLYARIHTGLMTDPAEINCYFKQIVNGVRYLHQEMGVAHRDLKPENLLLDKGHSILKITDFGVSDVFRAPLEKKARKMKGICGSSPYIAPEEFGDGPDGESVEYEPEPVDVWAIGIILYVMYYNAIPWKMAVRSDPRYKYYIDHKNGSFWPIDRFSPGPRKLLYRILDPNPQTRIKISEIVNDDWFKTIDFCTHATGAAPIKHRHGTSTHANGGSSIPSTMASSGVLGH